MRAPGTPFVVFHSHTAFTLCCYTRAESATILSDRSPTSRFEPLRLEMPRTDHKGSSAFGAILLQKPSTRRHCLYPDEGIVTGSKLFNSREMAHP
jgi:hypothetical protein